MVRLTITPDSIFRSHHPSPPAPSIVSALKPHGNHLGVHIRATLLSVIRRPHDVLATREARAQLPALLEHFREVGADAEPVVIGARRRPGGACVVTCRSARGTDGG